ncbi:hypothetical protein Tco_0846302 [Tanacetum coccineum]
MLHKPSLPQEVPLGNDLMQLKTLSISTTRGGSKNVMLGMDGGGFYGCLASKALIVSSQYGATPEEDNTFTAAVKCPSVTLRRHCLMLVLPVAPSFRKSSPP